MRAKRLSTVLLLLAALFLSPVAAMACACCSNEGEWSEYSGELDEYPRSILQEIKLGPRAELYASEAGDEEDSKGIEVIGYEYFVSLLPGAKQWELTFRNAKGKTGKLTLIIPTTYISYRVDTRERKPMPNGPILYKEWRLSGEVKGTGIFQKGLAEGGQFRLILQGRGNNCDNTEDFRNWVLFIQGPQADYSFNGKMRGVK